MYIYTYMNTHIVDSLQCTPETKQHNIAKQLYSNTNIHKNLKIDKIYKDKKKLSCIKKFQTFYDHNKPKYVYTNFFLSIIKTENKNVKSSWRTCGLL